MDQQKTGIMIAERRHQMGLTQKVLADKLGISDRTVSKWERGVGFPDVSLIEPLADALDLTVLELLHGQPEPPAPESESTARETLHAIRPQIERKMSRARFCIITMAVLLAVVIAAIPWLVSNAHSGWSDEQELNAAEAAAYCEDIIITSQDAALLEALLKDKTVAQIYDPDYPSWQPSTGFITLSNEEAAPYLELLEMKSAEPEFIIIQVSSTNIHIESGNAYTWVCLDYTQGEIEKIVVLNETPYRTTDGVLVPSAQRDGERLDLYNRGNNTFTMRQWKVGWLELYNVGNY